MGSEQASFEYLLRLIDHCKSRGITALLTNLTPTGAPGDTITGIDLSSVIDTVILLRHVEVRGELNRTLLILKSRGQRHSNRAQEFLITDNGIELLEPYSGAGGLLTGTERKEQELRDAAELEQLHAAVENQQHLLTQREAEMESQTTALEAEVKAAQSKLRLLETKLN